MMHDKLVDDAAMALCWAGFSNPESRPDTAKTYWTRVAPHAKAQYRKEVRAMLATFLRGWKPSKEAIAEWALTAGEKRLLVGIARLTASELEAAQGQSERG